jgi:hypothetical protein
MVCPEPSSDNWSVHLERSAKWASLYVDAGLDQAHSVDPDIDQPIAVTQLDQPRHPLDLTEECRWK